MNPNHDLRVNAHEFDCSDLEDPEIRERVQGCAIILGIDDSRSDHNETIFFGRSLLEDIAKGRAAEWPEGTEVARIHYSQSTTSLEWLSGVVQVLKGRCEYQASFPEGEK